MEKENYVQYSFKLNLNYPDHMRIHKTLMELDTTIFKSKTAFIIDALDKYIKGVSPEVLFGINMSEEYVSRVELEAIKVDIVKEATAEVTKNMSTILASAFRPDSGVINIDCAEE